MLLICVPLLPENLKSQRSAYSQIKSSHFQIWNRPSFWKEGFLNLLRRWEESAIGESVNLMQSDSNSPTLQQPSAWCLRRSLSLVRIRACISRSLKKFGNGACIYLSWPSSQKLGKGLNIKVKAYLLMHKPSLGFHFQAQYVVLHAWLRICKSIANRPSTG